MLGGLAMTKKKMGGLGKLSQFSGIKRQEEERAALQSAAGEPKAPVSPPKEKLATINTKITRAQQQWLTDTARTVRENNSDPVPPSERVFPQHLIGVAVELLQKAEVDWSQVRNVEELRNQLNL
jgi:hypothetical protein